MHIFCSVSKMDMIMPSIFDHLRQNHIVLQWKVNTGCETRDWPRGQMSRVDRVGRSTSTKFSSHLFFLFSFKQRTHLLPWRTRNLSSSAHIVEIIRTDFLLDHACAPHTTSSHKPLPPSSLAPTLPCHCDIMYPTICHLPMRRDLTNLGI